MSPARTVLLNALTNRTWTLNIDEDFVELISMVLLTLRDAERKIVRCGRFEECYHKTRGFVTGIDLGEINADLIHGWRFSFNMNLNNVCGDFFELVDKPLIFIAVIIIVCNGFDELAEWLGIPSYVLSPLETVFRGPTALALANETHVRLLSEIFSSAVSKKFVIDPICIKHELKGLWNCSTWWVQTSSHTFYVTGWFVVNQLILLNVSDIVEKLVFKKISFCQSSRRPDQMSSRRKKILFETLSGLFTSFLRHDRLKGELVPLTQEYRRMFLGVVTLANSSTKTLKVETFSLEMVKTVL